MAITEITVHMAVSAQLSRQRRIALIGSTEYSRSAEAEADIEALHELAYSIKAKREAEANAVDEE